MTVKDLDLY